MQVAIVTGATGGIGFGCATKLSEMGMAVLATGRNEQRLAELAEAIGASDRIATVAVDLTDDDAPSAHRRNAVERWGHIDFLINNAGVGNPTPLHGTDDETLDYFLNLMLRAPFRLARDAASHAAGLRDHQHHVDFRRRGWASRRPIFRGQGWSDRTDHPYRLPVRVARNTLQRRGARRDPDGDDRRASAGPSIPPDAGRDDTASAFGHRRRRGEHRRVLVLARWQLYQRADHRGRRRLEHHEVPVEVRVDIGMDSPVNLFALLDRAFTLRT